jgi:16S rRNA (guanine1207-N2)-methyltransferase
MGDHHYFSEDPRVASQPRTIEVTLPDLAFTMRTDAGVFSHGRVDIGTALLLATVPAPPTTGNLVDLGCGAGVIALTMAQRSPQATVWAIDVNTRARELCEANATQLGVTNLQVRHPEEFPGEVIVDAIWSNPPIRIGKAALHSLLLDWLGRLGARGEAFLVVQKHLGADSLQRWLTGSGYPTERLASRAAFRVLRAKSGADE